MIPYSTQSINDDDIHAVCDTLRSSHLTQGERTLEFENRLASLVNAKYAISFNSATSALYALYGAFMYKDFAHLLYDTPLTHPPEKICFITTPISFVATTNMMLQWGITPIFCDIKPDGNLDENALENLLKTHPQRSCIKAIVSVDYGGKSVEINKIRSLADKYKLTFFSDSSHSLGGSYHNQPIGSLADATIFSFHALKPITTAEGGALLTNDKKLAHFARLICSHGVQKNALWDYDCTLIGMNLRLSELGSALGISQLPRLQEFIAHRREIARFYDQYFAGNNYFETIPIPPHIQSSHHLYPILLRPNLWEKKEQIFQALLQKGLGVQVHYKPIYEFNLYRMVLDDDIQCKNASRFYRSEISIPCHQNLPLQEAKKIADTLLDICLKCSQ
ncbi:UDP-4-amino-4,6-dideoxy-N-acetyl-beta-L-altrosamine transaminase [Helicobacter sp. MIT 05-5293]|uniref:UDP-4-amino-4, 6-dideoxy-N-acetyl-beta-L-altrosamine transaminase n=1 Tax=Helicobacter sp. MIT 05-5293 TaxID=1548149 RepID=UPI00051DFD4B|nr:UDP-4-amino-4,6-dideoxy-N-acetyl-beta-L-altrosamine transaminase [Helicobacter sp. MIT 05-5293]TLD80391.1 UDP-4-amino-4,6-dideoxy-N-acetyl-beta-L-altrosamine transaminase [Helicobacter sp. MIT 05-5293]